MYTRVAAWASSATYMKRRKRQDGPETYMQQIWYLISVTGQVIAITASLGEEGGLRRTHSCGMVEFRPSSSQPSDVQDCCLPGLGYPSGVDLSSSSTCSVSPPTANLER
jgi:hypothetical protein